MLAWQVSSLVYTTDTKKGAVITVDPQDTVTLQNVTRLQLTASDFHMI